MNIKLLILAFLMPAFFNVFETKAQNQQYYGYAPLNPEMKDITPQGSGKNNYLEALICLDPISDPMMARLRGSQIMGVRCYLRSDYHQKSKGFSNILLYEGTTSSEPIKKTTNFDSGWNEILFDSPITIGDEKMFVGMRVFEIQGNPYPFAVYSPVSAPNSFYININRQEWIEYKDRGTLLIQAIVDADPTQFEQVASVRLAEFPLIVAPDKMFDGKIYVHNLSNHSISSIEVESITNGNNSEKNVFTLETPLPPYEGTIMPASLKSGKEEGTSEPITLKVTKVNGQDAKETVSNTSYLYISQDVFTRIPLIEEFTGLTCTACPFMAYYLDIALEKYTGPYVYVAHHAGYQNDILTSEVDKELLYLFGSDATYNPAIMYDRTVLKGQQLPLLGANEDSHEPYLAAINEVNHYPALAQVLVDLNKEDNKINCRVYGKISKDMMKTGKDYYVSTYLIEDNLTTDQYPQKGLDAPGAPDDLLERFRHNGVIRANLCTNVIGDKLSLDEEASFSIDYPVVTLSPDWKWENCQVIAFVHQINKENLRENIILNAGGNRLNDIALGNTISSKTINEIYVYAGQDRQIHVSVPTHHIEIFDLQGRFFSPSSVLSPGIYIVRCILNGKNEFVVQKVVVK